MSAQSPDYWSFLEPGTLDLWDAEQLRALHRIHGWGYKRLAARFGVREDVARNVILGRILNDGSFPRKPFDGAKETAFIEWCNGTPKDKTRVGCSGLRYRGEPHPEPAPGSSEGESAGVPRHVVVLTAEEERREQQRDEVDVYTLGGRDRKLLEHRDESAHTTSPRRFRDWLVHIWTWLVHHDL